MTRRKIKGVLFDKDGTLFDFEASWTKWMESVLQSLSRGDHALARRVESLLGFNTDLGKIDQGSPFVVGTPEDTFKELMRQFPELTASDIARTVGESSAEAEQIPAVPLRPLLGGLRELGLTLGVVTNDWERIAEAHLRAAGCRDCFAYVAGSDSGHGSKPDPGMLFAFCDATGIEPANCLMVGDSPADMMAGRRAGMTAIAVLTGMDTKAALEPHADAVLRNIGGLPEWIRRNNPQIKQIH